MIKSHTCIEFFPFFNFFFIFYNAIQSTKIAHTFFFFFFITQLLDLQKCFSIQLNVRTGIWNFKVHHDFWVQGPQATNIDW